MEEIWKSIGIKKYQVSNLGNVKGQDGIRLLKPAKNHHGYKYVLICNDGINKHRMIHHLVMEAFIGERNIGFVTDHINRIRDDNRLENLRYVTFLESSMNTSIYDKTILEHGKERYRIQMKKYYEKNKEQKKEYQKQYYFKKKQDEIIIE